MKKRDTKLEKAERILIDGGIDADKAKTALLDLRRVILDDDPRQNGI